MKTFRIETFAHDCITYQNDYTEFSNFIFHSTAKIPNDHKRIRFFRHGVSPAAATSGFLLVFPFRVAAAVAASVVCPHSLVAGENISSVGRDGPGRHAADAKSLFSTVGVFFFTLLFLTSSSSSSSSWKKKKTKVYMAENSRCDFFFFFFDQVKHNLASFYLNFRST